MTFEQAEAEITEAVASLKAAGDAPRARLGKRIEEQRAEWMIGGSRWQEQSFAIITR